jgi:hypothetical protein
LGSPQLINLIWVICYLTIVYCVSYLLISCGDPQSFFFFCDWHLSLAHHTKIIIKLWSLPKIDMLESPPLGWL